jgi:integrase
VSPFVFPNYRIPGQPMRDVRQGWANALRKAGISYFWLYQLRHSHASRLRHYSHRSFRVSGHSRSHPKIMQNWSFHFVMTEFCIGISGLVD